MLTSAGATVDYMRNAWWSTWNTREVGTKRHAFHRLPPQTDQKDHREAKRRLVRLKKLPQFLALRTATYCNETRVPRWSRAARKTKGSSKSNTLEKSKVVRQFSKQGNQYFASRARGRDSKLTRRLLRITAWSCSLAQKGTLTQAIVQERDMAVLRGTQAKRFPCNCANLCACIVSWKPAAMLSAQFVTSSQDKRRIWCETPQGKGCSKESQERHTFQGK